MRWVLNGQVAAEALGVTSTNVEEMSAKSTNAEVRRLLGAEGDFGADDGPVQGLDVQRHQAGRELRRVL